MDVLQRTDPEVWQAVQAERGRQQDGLEMIASENYTSPAVLAAQGSVLTNKYAEGYPGRRYYGGCELVDVCETLAINRDKQLFDAEHANAQPHSRAQANLAVYFHSLIPAVSLLSAHPVSHWHRSCGMQLDRSASRNLPSNGQDLDRALCRNKSERGARSSLPSCSLYCGYAGGVR